MLLYPFSGILILIFLCIFITASFLASHSYFLPLDEQIKKELSGTTAKHVSKGSRSIS